MKKEDPWNQSLEWFSMVDKFARIGEGWQK